MSRPTFLGGGLTDSRDGFDGVKTGADTDTAPGVPYDIRGAVLRLYRHRHGHQPAEARRSVRRKIHIPAEPLLLQGAFCSKRCVTADVGILAETKRDDVVPNRGHKSPRKCLPVHQSPRGG